MSPPANNLGKALSAAVERAHASPCRPSQPAQARRAPPSSRYSLTLRLPPSTVTAIASLAQQTAHTPDDIVTAAVHLFASHAKRGSLETQLRDARLRRELNDKHTDKP